MLRGLAWRWVFDIDRRGYCTFSGSYIYSGEAG